MSHEFLSMLDQRESNTRMNNCAWYEPNDLEERDEQDRCKEAECFGNCNWSIRHK